MSDYRLKYTNEEIDGKLDAVTRRNLLDNWYFGNPVNQRGQTTYTAPNGYAIDRWKVQNGADLSINNDSITLNYSGVATNTIVFRQEFEKPLKGVITISMLIKSKTGTWRLTYGDKLIDASSGLFSYTTTLTNSQWFYLWTTDAEASIELYAVKLELGDTQTLAHQENGVWVLNEIPDYGEELLKCQRYYYKSTGSGSAGAYTLEAASESYLIGNVRFPVPMRTAPAVTIFDYNGNSGKVSRWAGGEHNISATVNTQTLSKEGFNALSGTFSQGSHYAFHVEASADL